MKIKKTILMGCLSSLLFVCLSTQVNGQITIEKKGLKKQYLHEGEKIDNKQLASLLKADPSSADKYKISKTYSYVGLSSMVVGTAFIGVGFYYTIKSAQSVGENDLVGTSDYSNKSGNNILIGAGFYVLSVPFLLMSNSNLKKSINLYNSSTSTSGIHNLDLYVGFTGEGVGVGLRF